MESAFLNDKIVKPNDDLIFSLIGDTELLWKQTFSYLFDTSKDISVNWEYSDCGKYWGLYCPTKEKYDIQNPHFEEKFFSHCFPFR